MLYNRCSIISIVPMQLKMSSLITKQRTTWFIDCLEIWSIEIHLISIIAIYIYIDINGKLYYVLVLP